MRAASSVIRRKCVAHTISERYVITRYKRGFTALSYFWFLLQLIGAVPRVTEELSALQLAAYRHRTLST
jgi:hypothetical protein